MLIFDLFRPRAGWLGTLAEHWQPLPAARRAADRRRRRPRERAAARVGARVAGRAARATASAWSARARVLERSARADATPGGKRPIACIKRALRHLGRDRERRRRAGHAGALAPERRALRRGVRRACARSRASCSRRARDAPAGRGAMSARRSSTSSASAAWWSTACTACRGCSARTEKAIVLRDLGRRPGRGARRRRRAEPPRLGGARSGCARGIFGLGADDENGRFLRAAMDRLGIEHAIVLDGSASSVAEIFVDDAGERAIYMAPGATSETTRRATCAPPRDVRPRRAAASRPRCRSSRSPRRSRRSRIAREAGVPTVVDLDVPPSRRGRVRASATRRALDAVLRGADLLKPSKSACRELVAARRRRPRRARARAARALRQRAVVVTDGEAGCAIAADGFEGFVRARAREGALDDRRARATPSSAACSRALAAGLAWEDGGAARERVRRRVRRAARRVSRGSRRARARACSSSTPAAARVLRVGAARGRARAAPPPAPRRSRASASRSTSSTRCARRLDPGRVRRGARAARAGARARRPRARDRRRQARARRALCGVAARLDGHARHFLHAHRGRARQRRADRTRATS